MKSEEQGMDVIGKAIQFGLLLFAGFFASVPLAVVLVKTGAIQVEKPEPKQPSSYEQVCKECGTVWIVTPTRPGQGKKPVVEWCFNDGEYCEEGFSLLLDSTKNGKSSEVEVEFLNHCMTCKGCRFAAFQPEDWKKVTDAIKKIRKQ